MMISDLKYQVIDSLKNVVRPTLKNRFLIEKWRYRSETILNKQQGNDRIAELIHTPAAIAKIGATEMKLSRVFLRRKTPEGFCNRFGRYGETAPLQSGIYPNDPQSLSRFCGYFLGTLKHLDVLVVWYNFGEHAARRKFAPQAELCVLKANWPYYNERPWSAQLAGKRVLVVSPFEKTIYSQYKKRHLLWPTKPDLLPEFDLRVIRCPLMAGLVEPEYPDWFAGLEALKEKMAKVEFDVALIGAGGWSIPLAVHAKSLGACGIHMGGDTQILFGIRGGRWEKHDIIPTLINDSWVRPDPTETPTGHRRHENGSYW